jgi:hypothetical protein
MSATSLSQSTTSTQSLLFAGRYKILIFVEGGGNREGGQGRKGFFEYNNHSNANNYSDFTDKCVVVAIRLSL